MKIAVSSGKGGTGKTTIASNLAAYLSENKYITLVDLDVEEPNSGLFIIGDLLLSEDKFKQVPKWERDRCKPCDICTDVCNFNALIKLGSEIMNFPDMCHSCFACTEMCPENALPMENQLIGKLSHFRRGNLDFIDSRLDIGREQAVPLIKQTLEYIDSTFSDDSIIIMDTPPGTSCPVIESTKKADIVVLVTEPTPFGLHDLKLSVGAMRKLGRRIVVVINRYGIGNSDTEEYCLEENIPIIARFGNDREVAELYSRGELIYDKKAEFKWELGKIAEHLGLNKNE